MKAPNIFFDRITGFILLIPSNKLCFLFTMLTIIVMAVADAWAQPPVGHWDYSEQAEVIRERAGTF